MGLFGKIKNALKKTKEGVSHKMRQLFLKNKIGNDFYDELEEILISADVSVRTAEEVVEQVKEEAIGNKVKDEAYVTDLLKDILEDTLNEAPVPEFEYPCVIMLVGVNGVGKTTLSNTRTEAIRPPSYSMQYRPPKRAARTLCLWIRLGGCM